MRIGVNAMHIYSDKHAGVSRVSQRLLHAMFAARPNHTFFVFLRHDQTPPEGWTQLKNVRLVFTWPKTRLWNLIGRDLAPIVYRLSAWYSPSGKVPRTPMRRKIGTAHDIFFRSYGKTYTPSDVQIHEAMYANVAKYATSVACISQATLREFSGAYAFDPQNCFVVRLGPTHVVEPVAPESVTTGELAEIGVTSDRYFFAVSTLEPRKNFPALMRAFAAVKDRPEMAGVNLVIAGARGWKEQGVFEELQRLNLEERVNMLGYVKDEDMPKLFAKSIAAVTASLDEGFGLPLLEAMHYGALTVSSNRGALPEVGGDLPIYFDPGDEASIAEALLRSLSLPGRAERIELGKARAATFTWEIGAEDVLSRLEAP